MNVAGMTVVVRVRMARVRVVVVVAVAMLVGMVAHRTHSTRSGGGWQRRIELSGKFDTGVRGMD